MKYLIILILLTYPASAFPRGVYFKVSSWSLWSEGHLIGQKPNIKLRVYINAMLKKSKSIIMFCFYYPVIYWIFKFLKKVFKVLTYAFKIILYMSFIYTQSNRPKQKIRYFVIKLLTLECIFTFYYWITEIIKCRWIIFFN
jgi:hypothetical protein